ncbi:MAG: hypothetical protein QXN51_00240 [Ignisphaera sp.]
MFRYTSILHFNGYLQFFKILVEFVFYVRSVQFTEQRCVEIRVIDRKRYGINLGDILCEGKLSCV